MLINTTHRAPPCITHRYIAIPDCFWGDAQFGLEAPPDLTGLPLHMVKRANATWGHYGEMAGGQPFVF
jgi:hypothetical protein